MLKVATKKTISVSTETKQSNYIKGFVQEPQKREKNFN